MLRITGTVVNTTVAVVATVGIIVPRDVIKPRDYDGYYYGGHINIMKSWARLLLKCIGYVKRKYFTAGKVTFSELDEIKERSLQLILLQNF